MQDFSFHNPCQIEFGRSKAAAFTATVRNLSNRILLLYGGGSIKKNGVYDLLTAELNKADVFISELSGVQPNPDINTVREGARLCRENNLGLVLAAGGGSVIDCAKAIAFSSGYDGDPWDYFTGKKQVTEALPVAAWLTLAATGSEMNGNSVISNRETREKLHAGSPILIPSVSLLDAEATTTLPARQTAAGTADIMSHVFEQYFSSEKETYLQDRMAEAGLRTCITWAPVAMMEPDNIEARKQLLWAGTIGLNGLLGCGKPGDWGTHMMEHEVSAVTDMTHGVGLAILTPHWMDYIFDRDSLPRFAALAREVWSITEEDDEEAGRKGIAALRQFFQEMDLPSRLRDEGVKEAMLPEIAAQTVRRGRVGGYRPLKEKDVLKILEAAF